MSSPTAATTSEPRPRRTDSPWFWVYLFCAAGFAALLLMNDKYQHRQTDIEDVYRFGTRTLHRSPGATLSDNAPHGSAQAGAAKSAEPTNTESLERAPLAEGPQPPTHKMLIPLAPLRVITGIAMVISFIAMQWSYVRRVAQAKQ
jgi:hypothetical protein